MKMLFKQCEVAVELEENRGFHLEYFLIEENQGGTAENIYGIQIIKTEDEIVEKEFASGISYSRDLVDDLLNKLIRNTVTPVCMLETIDELVTIHEINN